MKKLHGKTQGLKAAELKRLEKLQSRKLGVREAISSDVARAMASVCADVGRMVGLLVDRKGAVTDVILGEPTRLYLPDIGRHRAGPARLRGLRLLVCRPAAPDAVAQTRRHAMLPIAKDLLTDLERLRLDMVVEFEAHPDGLPGRASFAHVSPSALPDASGEIVRSQQERFRSVHDIAVDFDVVVASLEEELARHASDARTAEKIDGERDRAVVVGAYTGKRHEMQASIAELTEMARTAGVRVVDTIVQRRSQLDPRTIVGKGKLEEICLQALHQGADLLIFDLDLKPSQLNAITDLTDLRILDRTMLILDIFARRAKSRGGRMQVELAQLKYAMPRLAKKQEGLSRLAGGIGGQGPGETKLEIDRRRVKDRIARLERDIERFGKERELRRQRRNNRQVPTIAIVGYTNAGKSTLLNQLTGAEVFADNLLFATLDPTSRRLRFPREREVVLIDTVGFIRDLPETLVNAFRATLEELHDADLLLHVVDISDPRREAHIEAVEKVLTDIGVERTPRLLVFNKRDTLDDETAESIAERKGGLAVSAFKRLGLERLLNRAAEILWREDALPGPQTWAKEAVVVDESEAAGDLDGEDATPADAMEDAVVVEDGANAAEPEEVEISPETSVVGGEAPTDAMVAASATD